MEGRGDNDGDNGFFLREHIEVAFGNFLDGMREMMIARQSINDSRQ